MVKIEKIPREPLDGDMRVLKFATGEVVPEGAEYLCTIKNGVMSKETGYEYVWHYFMVPAHNFSGDSEDVR